MKNILPAKIRAVVSGGAGGALAPPEFGNSVHPIPTREGRLCPTHYWQHPQTRKPNDSSDLVQAASRRIHSLDPLPNKSFIFACKRRNNPTKLPKPFHLTSLFRLRAIVRKSEIFCQILRRPIGSQSIIFILFQGKITVLLYDFYLWNCPSQQFILYRKKY